jgi:hypothetical protein
MLKRYIENGIEIVIDSKTGETYLTIAGYAKMMGKDKSATYRRLYDMAETPKGGVTTKAGIVNMPLLNESIIIDWLMEDDLKFAKQLSKTGVRKYLQDIAKYKKTTKEKSDYNIDKMTNDIVKVVSTTKEVIDMANQIILTSSKMIDNYPEAKQLKKAFVKMFKL